MFDAFFRAKPGQTYAMSEKKTDQEENFFAYEKVSVEDAKKALEQEAGGARHKQDWTAQRSAAVVKLLPATEKWLAGLPERVRPVELARGYPRIANDLARLWQQPKEWDVFLDELLLVRYGDRVRQGFPAPVASELAALNNHHTTLYPPDAAAGGL